MECKSTKTFLSFDSEPISSPPILTQSQKRKRKKKKKVLKKVPKLQHLLFQQLLQILSLHFSYLHSPLGVNNCQPGKSLSGPEVSNLIKSLCHHWDKVMPILLSARQGEKMIEERKSQKSHRENEKTKKKKRAQELDESNWQRENHQILQLDCSYLSSKNSPIKKALGIIK